MFCQCREMLPFIKYLTKHKNKIEFISLALLVEVAQHLFCLLKEEVSFDYFFLHHLSLVNLQA